MKYYLRNKRCIKLVFIAALMSFIIGFIFYYVQDAELKERISMNISGLQDTISSTNQNNILFHLSLVSIISILSLTIFGSILGYIYYFYEFLSLGFFMGALFYYKKFEGLLFGTYFIIVNKMFFLLILTYFIISTINYAKRYLKTDKALKGALIISQLYKSFFVFFSVLFIDIFLYFCGNKLLSIFSFLIAN